MKKSLVGAFLFLASCAAYTAPLPDSPQESMVPHKLTLPTDKDGNVVLSKDKINFIMFILNQQRAIIERAHQLLSEAAHKNGALEECVRTTTAKAESAAVCLSDAPAWGARFVQ